MKRYMLRTVDTRQFVQDLLAIGAQGGVLRESGVVRKGLMMMAEIDVPQEGIVPTSPTMFLTASSRADQVKQIEQLKDAALNVVPDDVEPTEATLEPVKEGYTREELMEMPIAQVRKVTGLTGRSKEDIVDGWLASQE